MEWWCTASEHGPCRGHYGWVQWDGGCIWCFGKPRCVLNAWLHCRWLTEPLEQRGRKRPRQASALLPSPEEAAGLDDLTAAMLSGGAALESEEPDEPPAAGGVMCACFCNGGCGLCCVRNVLTSHKQRRTPIWPHSGRMTSAAPLHEMRPSPEQFMAAVAACPGYPSGDSFDEYQQLELGGAKSTVSLAALWATVWARGGFYTV